MSKNNPEQKIVALDCATVAGPNNQHILTRVSIVDFYGKVVFDTFVSHEQCEVHKYLIKESGIQQEQLTGAPSFRTVQKTVYDIISDKIVVGHNLHFDFLILGLTNPVKFVRDIGTNSFILGTYGHTSKQPVSLNKLTKLILQREIQLGCQDPIEEATAAMDIYKYFQMEIENGHLKDMKAMRDESLVFPQTEIDMESKSSNGTRNALIGGGILAAGILAVGFSIFGKRRSHNK